MTVLELEVKEALPIRLTKFFLSTAGFTIITNKKQRIIVKAIVVYSVIAIAFSIYTTIVDLLHCWGDFYNFVYSFIAFGTCFIVQSKFGTFMIQKKRYIKLMKYTNKILWTQYHNDYGKTVIKQCEKQAMIFIVFFTIMAQSVIICYIIQPILLILQSNRTERAFPFPMWVNLPIYDTPWFQIIFVCQAFSGYHTAICYFCFDNYLALINIFVTGQFDILRNRFEAIFNMPYFHDEKRLTKSLLAMTREFKECVKQHQVLIELVEEVEAIYTVINLVQVLVFSFLICLVGYQLLLEGNALMRRIIFITYFAGCFTQLFTFAFTANNLTIASVEVGEGPWHSKWYSYLRTSRGRALARDFQMVIMRAQRPCRLTACGFFPITVNTFKSMLSTAFSYLTLMRGSDQR